MKPIEGNDTNKDLRFEFSFAFGYEKKNETPLLVYADELFDAGMIKPMKVYKDSELLIPKRKKEISSTIFEPLSNFAANIQRDSRETMEKSSLRSSSSSSLNDWYKKWKLKNLLLFRSASEGHARSTRIGHGKKCHETISLGFRERRKEGISAHERHYINNRKAGEEIKRKTFLPYKKTLLMGCSDLDPGVYEFCKGHAVELKC